MTYTRFNQIKDTGKTKVWAVYNSDNGSHLGEIRWYGAWRKYVLAVAPGTIWSADCLVDVARFIETQMAARQAGVKVQTP